MCATMKYYVNFMLAAVKLLCTLFIVKETSCITMNDVETFLQNYNKHASMLQKIKQEISWELGLGGVDKKKVKSAVLISLKADKLTKLLNRKAEAIYNSTKDLVNLRQDLNRQFMCITEVSTPRNFKDEKLLQKTVKTMEKIYISTRIIKKVNGKTRKLQLNSHLIPMFTKVSSEKLGSMLWAWKAWRKAVGPKVKPHYIKVVQLSNEAAKERGYKDLGEFWRSDHDMDPEKFRNKTAKLNAEIQRLYKKLHAYIRFKLREHLGDKIIDENEMIPAHILGMWPNNWGSLYSIATPYPEKRLPDITKKMKEKGMSKISMVKMAEKFFTAIGFDEAPKTFWTKSIFKKVNKKMPCLASAYDIGQGDVRMKMPCLQLSESQLKTVHHEMGHIKYFQSYLKQPFVFRKAANQGIQEAVGDVIALSLAVPSHLKDIGLLDEIHNDKEEDINFLMKQALEYIPKTIFTYSLELWRWSVYSGKTTPDKYNADWWNFRHKTMGVKSPIPRPEEEFDAGCFAHVDKNKEYIPYFTSNFMKYAMHKSLCEAAGNSEPIFKCSICKSKKAGEKLKALMSLGKSKTWQETLAVVTGEKGLTADALLEYYSPLEGWLDRHRKENGYQIGWNLNENQEESNQNNA